MNIGIADGESDDELIDIGSGGASEEIFAIDDAFDYAGAVGISLELDEVAGTDAGLLFETLQQSAQTACDQLAAALDEEEAVVEFDHAPDHSFGTFNWSSELGARSICV